MFVTVYFALPYPVARSDMFGADIPVLVQILAENIKHFQQFQAMIEQGKNSDQYLRLVNAGLENSIGLLRALPVKDEKILAQLQSFHEALDIVSKVYGRVPHSQMENIQTLNDQSVAESIRMTNSFKDYSDQQEANSTKLMIESREASPKGAERMQVEASAQILGSLSQLIRLNTQMLKLQSEQLALNNKGGKDQVSSYQKVDLDLQNSFQNFQFDMKLQRF